MMILFKYFGKHEFCKQRIEMICMGTDINKN